MEVYCLEWKEVLEGTLSIYSLPRFRSIFDSLGPSMSSKGYSVFAENKPESSTSSISPFLEERLQNIDCYFDED